MPSSGCPTMDVSLLPEYGLFDRKVNGVHRCLLVIAVVADFVVASHVDNILPRTLVDFRIDAP